MTYQEIERKLNDAYKSIGSAFDAINVAQYYINDVRNALTDEYTAIHQDLVEVKWFKTAKVQPANGQKVIVRTQTGEVYFLTYPFSHTRYPMWWVIPQTSK